MTTPTAHQATLARTPTARATLVPTLTAQETQPGRPAAAATDKTRPLTPMDRVTLAATAQVTPTPMDQATTRRRQAMVGTTTLMDRVETTAVREATARPAS